MNMTHTYECTLYEYTYLCNSVFRKHAQVWVCVCVYVFRCMFISIASI